MPWTSVRLGCWAQMLASLSSRGLKGVVLLNAQITHRVAGLVQGADQLRLVVEESLAPLGMAGSHGQHPALQR